MLVKACCAVLTASCMPRWAVMPVAISLWVGAKACSAVLLELDSCSEGAARGAVLCRADAAEGMCSACGWWLHPYSSRHADCHAERCRSGATM